MKKISVILPCYNEEKSLPLYFKAVDEVLKTIKDYKVEFILVNDGSKDKTLEVMLSLYEKRDDIVIVNLSKNFGQNPAFCAGLETTDADYAIMMDADLQDPVYLLKEIADKFTEGYEVVNPHRADRKTDTYFKRKTAGIFYKFINHIERKEVIPENVNCFRGISRRVIDEINSLTEKDRYLRTEVPFVGFKTCQIDFKREKRSAGESKFTLLKMINHALDNFSSATAYPLYIPVKVGVFSTFFFFLSSITMTICYFLSFNNIIKNTLLLPLQSFMIISYLFLVGSIIILVLGVIAIYIHSILINTRNRPNYIIDKVYKK